MTAKEKFEKMLKDRRLVDDAEEIISAVSDFLYAKADKIKQEEPYATRTIQKYEDAARVVFNVLVD